MSDPIPECASKVSAATATQQAAAEVHDLDPAYLQSLTKCEQDMIDEFNKAVMTLSGGAIGVSFAFLKDIVKPEDIVNKGWLLTAWVCWGLSVLTVLASFYFSHLVQCLIKDFTK